MMPQMKIIEMQRPKPTSRLCGRGDLSAGIARHERSTPPKAGTHVVVQSTAATAPIKTAIPNVQSTVCHHISSRKGGEAAYLTGLEDISSS